MEEQFFEKDGVIVLILKGNLVAENVEKAFSFLSQKINEKKFQFVFDLSEVTRMGSTALGMLAVSIREALAHNTRVRLVNPHKNIVSLLQNTSLLDLCHIFATVEEAISSFQINES